VQNVEPGAEFPLVTFDRPTPLVKQVEKFGGKFFVTDEAKDRNDPMMLQQGAAVGEHHQPAHPHQRCR
jgi:hypothetical protein